MRCFERPTTDIYTRDMRILSSAGWLPWCDPDDPDAQRDEGFPVLDRGFTEAYGAARDRLQ